MRRATDAIVATWTFAAVEQILERTASSHFLAQAANPISVSQKTPGSTLAPRPKTAQWKPSGLANVASHRADLILMQRKILERLPTWRAEHSETVKNASKFLKVASDVNGTNAETVQNGTDSYKFPTLLSESYHSQLSDAAISTENARSVFYVSFIASITTNVLIRLPSIVFD